MKINSDQEISQPITAENSSGEVTSGTEPLRSIVLTAQFENLELMREFVADAAEDCGFEPSEIYAVQLAVDEAFSNIIEHAYGGECLESVLCTCHNTGDALTVTLRDCGQPFNPIQIPDPDITADLESRKIGGLGLYFMRQLMDEVDFEFTSHPETGKPCNLLKLVKRKDVGK